MSQTNTTRTLRIGAGSSYAGDRIEPGVDLAARGNLDYLVYETLVSKGPGMSSLPRKTVREVLGIVAVLIPRAAITPSMQMFEVPA